jgi:hypothetical protein
MKQIENDCVDCGLPCLGNGCPYRNVLQFYCDECGDETELYHFNGKELCLDCIKDSLERVTE